MKEYIKANFTYIGKGNTREVYRQNDKVYKIASYPACIENNEIEFQRYTELPQKLLKYVPQMELAVKGSYEILKVEYIEPLEKWLVRNHYMLLQDFLDACSDGQGVDDLCDNLNLSLYFPYELIAFLRNLGSSENELYYPANFGVKDNTLILLDFADRTFETLENTEMSSLSVF